MNAFKSILFSKFVLMKLSKIYKLNKIKNIKTNNRYVPFLGCIIIEFIAENISSNLSEVGFFGIV